MKKTLKRKYGWKRQLPDFRDKKYMARPQVLADLPSKVDLRDTGFMPPIYDQGSLGSCTANAIGSSYQFGQLKQLDEHAFIPSRLFLYYNERDMEGTINEDCGAIIRDGMKSAAKDGMCPETMWPYKISKFATKPSSECYIEAEENQVLSYHAVEQSLNSMKACLAEGYPFVFGFAVYTSFETSAVSKTGIMTMPSINDSMVGGHAVKAVGYDDTKKCFIIKNSWGEGWGDKGYFYMPYEYITNPQLASDFWTIRLVEDNIEEPTPKPQPKITLWQKIRRFFGL